MFFSTMELSGSQSLLSNDQAAQSSGYASGAGPLLVEPPSLLQPTQEFEAQCGVSRCRQEARESRTSLGDYG